MLQSKLFTKTRKEAPKDESSKNAQLLIRAGFIHKEMAGVYSYLPLGLRVLKKIENILREEMLAIGAHEVLLTTLQNPLLWSKTGRWQDDVITDWFKSQLKKGSEIGLALTHEEPLTELLKEHISSHKDLPLGIFQIQNKFRNELRSKSGILRGREFMMKDLYSFSKSETEHEEFYMFMQDVYMKIFNRVGIGSQTYLTFASGGTFAEFSHEFQTVCDAGEDTIYLNENKKIAINKEVYTDEVIEELGLEKSALKEVKSIEVGNIFNLGTRFSKTLGLKFRNEKEKEHFPVMGSYGIGLGRLMGTVVEVLSDDKGIIWPESIAPFMVHLISLEKNDEAKDLYEKLQNAGIEVLYDDRSLSAGEKFADSDLLGIPYRVVISEKTMKMKKLEVKRRDSSKDEMMVESELISLLSTPR